MCICQIHLGWRFHTEDSRPSSFFAVTLNSAIINRYPQGEVPKNPLTHDEPYVWEPHFLVNFLNDTDQDSQVSSDFSDDLTDSEDDWDDPI